LVFVIEESAERRIAGTFCGRLVDAPTMQLAVRERGSLSTTTCWWSKWSYGFL
jgi:hypothetical protein